MPVVLLCVVLGVGLVLGIVRGVRDLRRGLTVWRYGRRQAGVKAPAPKVAPQKAPAPKVAPAKVAAQKAPVSSLPAGPLSKDTPIERTSGGNGRSAVANQLSRVQAAGFSSKPVMNKSEYQVFLHVEELIQTRYRGCRLFAQTSLGEILGSDDQKAFISINSKRIDMLIMGTDGYPAVAIEYQGTGHYQGDAEVRDAIKREALERAGVPLVEIFPNDTGSSIQSKIAKAMKQKRGRV